MMERTPIDNDTRGWILCFVSGAACVLGSSVICVDFLIRLLPGHSSFSINRSSVFLASSLSLSFGVMLFSALYSMLPNAKEYFIEAGYGSQAAGTGLAKAREPDVAEVAPASPAPTEPADPPRGAAPSTSRNAAPPPLLAPEDVEAQHHHHVPTNAFLSLGLQTSIAIALHKFPEGFITFATNHANPTLGFNVFMALFVHNITEGFTIALPLYMALGSRAKAMLWASILGGLSQPLGAAVAALWFRLARKTHMAPNTAVYAGLFAITAGIMVSVALQLFVESLSLNHNRNLSTFFAFLGMIVLGLSNSLVESD
ncbi:unnamed protein product [Parascedosporium putredinis]|uniref:Zinc/iron permease n=1 Tax=Parascedosporium putredinis TaxID=1442378 RepID=A0A9P1H6U9_9PEZI|nr:unnamed protein product [Parascedosporium putredinis]CAI8000787.1 unnamed protein product [Parascedosporium putredinis]